MRYLKIMTIGVLALAAVSCRRKSAFDSDEATLQSNSGDTVVVVGEQRITSSDELDVSTSVSDDNVPKVSCNRSSVDENGSHIGTCTEYFVGPEESLQVDKATELESACVDEGGVWDVQGCREEENLLGTCRTPASGNEPAIKEFVYGSNAAPANGDATDDSQTSCAAPSVWVPKS